MLKSLNRILLSNVLGVNLLILSFATSTTTLFLSLATFARLAGDTGHAEELSVTFRLAVAAVATREANPVEIIVVAHQNLLL